MKYPKEVEQKVIDCYLNDNISCTKLGKKLGIQRQTISIILKRNNITVINKHNQIKVRKDLFEKINNEADAYWLGFIYADGYISDKGAFELGLAAKDKNHITKFAEYCNFKGNVYNDLSICNGKKFPRTRINFQYKFIKERLNKLGVYPRKSNNLVFPSQEIVPQHLVKHFIRGYVDGDGGFNCYMYGKRKTFCFHCLGTYDIISSIRNYLPVKSNSKLYKKYKESNCFQFRIGGRLKLLTVINYLYKDSTIYLDRKYLKYKEICRLFEKSDKL
jgi:hypothetical protein